MRLPIRDMSRAHPQNPVTTETLQAAARAAHAQLPDNVGFILITVPFGESEAPRAQYVSNIKRADAVGTLKELLARWGLTENWMEECE